MNWISLIGLLVYRPVNAKALHFAVATPSLAESTHHSNRTKTRSLWMTSSVLYRFFGMVLITGERSEPWLSE
jgi:hypothetical protein